VAQRTIPNLPAVVALSPTAQIEIVQAGTSMRASAGQIAKLGSSVVFDVTNNITDTAVFYPLYLSIYEGTTNTAYASSPNYLYVPQEGRLSSLRPEAMQGVAYNANTVTQNYTFPTGDNGMSAGPIVISAVLTVPTGSNWVVI